MDSFKSDSLSINRDVALIWAGKKMRAEMLAEYSSEARRKMLSDKVAYLAHEHAINYIGNLVAGNDEDATPDVRFKAAKELLDRYLGKPKESVDVNTSVNLHIDL